MKEIDLTDMRFGRLTALYRGEKTKHGTKWVCRCDCGNVHSVLSSNLRAGKQKSCGCLKRVPLERRKGGANTSQRERRMILTKDNYFSREANMEYMSVSQFKSFCTCPAATMAELTGEYERETTTALLVGSYVDAHFEGTLDLFKGQHPELFTKGGGLKSEYRKAKLVRCLQPPVKRVKAHSHGRCHFKLRNVVQHHEG